MWISRVSIAEISSAFLSPPGALNRHFYGHAGGRRFGSIRANCVHSGFAPTLLQLPDIFSILTLVSCCALLGALAGFLGGLLGIGGGVVMVPGLAVLFDVLGLFPESGTLFALGTSLLVIVFTSLSAARAQILAGKVIWQLVKTLAPWLIVGGFAAGWLAVSLPIPVLRGFIALFLFAVAAIMLANWKPLPGREMPGRVGSAVLGTGAGLISGLAGIGGGNVIVPTFLYHNVPVHNATATSSTLGVPVAAAGALGYALQGEVTSTQLGFIYLPAAAALVVASVALAPFGVRVAHKTDATRLKKWFGGLLILVASRMLYTALT